MHTFQWQVARWTCLLVIGMTFHESTGNLCARLKAPASQEAIPAIAIHVHNYAAVPARTLEHAQAEAGSVLLLAGVALHWIDCPLKAADLERYPACVQHSGLGVIDLNLLPHAMTAAEGQSDSTLGLTPMSNDGERVALTMILFNLVEAHASTLDTSVDRLLAHAMAHEFGHILLRTHGHSSAGIMRAKWTPGDLQLAARGLLVFTPEQAETIRTEVSTRDRMQEDDERVGIAARK